MANQKESEIQKSIIDYLKSRGLFVWRSPNGAPRHTGVGRRKSSMLGLPDITGILPNGVALFIEVKKPKGVVSENQKWFLSQASSNGALAFTAFSLEEAVTYLESYLKEQNLLQGE